MINNRILGPINGYYVSVATLALGEFGREHLGVFRLYDREPADHFDVLPLFEQENPQPFRNCARAIDAATQRGCSLARSLSPGPCQPRETRTGLSCILYASGAMEDPTRADLQTLVSAARMRNADLGITGHLLMIDGHFMQYLEGPRSHVELVYASIRQDRRHDAMIELVRERIEQRAYSDWTLAFEHVDDLGELRDAPPLLSAADHRSAMGNTMSYFARTLNVPRVG